MAQERVPLLNNGANHRSASILFYRLDVPRHVSGEIEGYAKHPPSFPHRSKPLLHLIAPPNAASKVPSRL